MYKLVDENGNEVSLCYINGYHVADRFLEDCYFRVSLNETQTEVVVEATDSTKKYLLGNKADVNGWEQEVKSYVISDENENLSTSPSSRSKTVFLEKN